MTTQSYLTFTVHGLLLAVETKVVREIIWLPELTLIEECPSYIAGVVNRHGKILPVMDLTVRFGHPPERYRCAHRVVILDVAELVAAAPGLTRLAPTGNATPDLMGVIAHEVLDVIDIAVADIEIPPFAGREFKAHPHFVGAVARAGEDIVMMLANRTFFDWQFGQEEAEVTLPDAGLHPARGYFCPEADAGEREMFHRRAMSLHQEVVADDDAVAIPVAVIGFGREFFAVEIGTVREFAKMNNLTPVPCCPIHIAGNMNLRGNVLTVVDIRGLLHMQPGEISASAKVIVADTGEFSVGVVVDEIFDIIYVSVLHIVPVSSALHGMDDKFVKGAIQYNSMMIAVLDFNAILSWDGLVVDEEVLQDNTFN
jgi:purine-binding chemotaxis protein CheW